MTMKLYDYPKSGNGYKVRLLLAQLGLSYDYIPLDILQGATRTPDFLRRNPNGKIPLLELDDGTFLAESNAILYFLAQGSEFWPASAFEQALVMQWMFFEQYSHEPNLATARFWLAIDKQWIPTPFTREVLAMKQARGREALALMDEHLRKQPFLVGSTYSIADICLYAYTHVAGEGGFDLAAYPAVGEWLERVRSQPRYISIDSHTF
jgi:glutathione S-transferase